MPTWLLGVKSTRNEVAPKALRFSAATASTGTATGASPATVSWKKTWAWESVNEAGSTGRSKVTMNDLAIGVPSAAVALLSVSPKPDKFSWWHW